MTMLVGINFGEYILIAADKGRTQNGELSSFDEKKITQGQNICITATGYVDIIEKVKSKIINDKVYKIQDVIKIINEEKEKFLKDIKNEHYSKNEIEGETGFLLVYKDKEHFNLAVHYPDWNERYCKFNNEKKHKEAYIIEKNKRIVTPPAEFNRDNGAYQRILHIIDNCIKSERNKEKELEVLKEIFLIMSQNSKQVTKEFDYYFVS